MKNSILSALMIALFPALAISQTRPQTEKDSVTVRKFSVSTTWLTFDNHGPEATNVHMYEFHFGYKISPKDKIEIKIATWKLFEPMGIPLGNPLLKKESEFYPGRLKESGIGVTYQRFIWKGLFATVEILPLLKTYLDEDNKKICNGFKLYTTYHLGYHIPMFKGRIYIEPQIHCNYWPIDTNIPQGFKEKENRWNNYFLFEPNLFFGINF
jgi:hypothetical protein